MKDPRMILGIAIVSMLFILAMSMALGKVEESTSYGLAQVLECFKTLSGVFAGWAFGRSMESPK